jgi:hypothetical protein
MFKNPKVIIASLLLSLPFQAFADDAKAAEKEKKPALEKVSKSEESVNPWTDCGIGAMLFDETKWAAVISNVIWDYGLTATTSAVSSKHTCEGKKVVAALFINETYENLAEETATGSGSHVDAVLNILGCSNAAQPAILASVRSDFSNHVLSASYAEQSASEKAQAYYFLLEKTIAAQYASQCQA